MNRAERRAAAVTSRGRRIREVNAPAAPERRVRRSREWLGLLDSNRSEALAMLTHVVGVENVPDALALIESRRPRS